jgi:hypothetical protein
MILSLKSINRFVWLVVVIGKHYVLCEVRTECLYFDLQKKSTVHHLVHPSFADAHSISSGRYLAVEFVSLELKETDSVTST